MAKVYSQEEKQELLDQYKISEGSKTEFSRKNGIPEATFRAWVKEEQYKEYGEIYLNESKNNSTKEGVANIEKPIIFIDKHIRLELKPGYDKELLKKIVEVLSTC